MSDDKKLHSPYLTKDTWVTYDFIGNEDLLYLYEYQPEKAFPRILQDEGSIDEESMKALKLLKDKGYSIDKIAIMLEKYDFS